MTPPNPIGYQRIDGRQLGTEIEAILHRSIFSRQTVFCPTLNDPKADKHEYRFVPNVEANLVSSAPIEPESDDQQLPIFDFDFPVAVCPSSNRNHSHLYINKRISWEAYVRILDAFLAAGLLDKFWVEQTKTRGYALLRLPNILKPSGAPSSKGPQNVMPAPPQRGRINHDDPENAPAQEAFDRALVVLREADRGRWVDVAVVPERINWFEYAAPRARPGQLARPDQGGEGRVEQGPAQQ